MNPKLKRYGLRASLYVAIVIVSFLMAVFVQSSILGAWAEQKSYDLRFRLRGVVPAPDSVPVVIVAIDENSLSQIPDPLMLWQQYFAEVLDYLVQGQVGAVGLDFLLSDISFIEPGGQQALLAAILRARASEIPVVLAYRVRGDRVEQPPPIFTMAAGTEAFGYVNLTTDSDDFVRRQELFAYDENQQKSFGFAFALANAFSQGRVGEIELPSQEGSTVLINYRGPGYFRQVSFLTALEAARRQDLPFFEANFKDRIVILGRVGQQGDEDLHSTPFYDWSDGSALQARRTPGVEVHANVIVTLLEEIFIGRAEPARQALMTLVVVALVTAACFLLPAVAAVVIGMAVMAVYLLFSFYWAFQGGLWLWVVSPTLGGVTALASSQVTNYVLEGREKRHLRKLFQRYVKDDVIEKILDTPDGLALGGDRREIAVLFSDIRGFTTRSEKDSAETVVYYLNQYFTAMVDAIQENGGMVDKFIGDGIMAIFGAPIEDSEAAYHAVKAAQAMLESLAVLNRRLTEEGIEPIGIGIGIHTGEAVVGNIGSPQRMDYTAIGDVVNTASRIEGLTRKLEADALISEETYQLLEGRVEAEYVGRETLKGKAQPLPLYRLDWSGGEDQTRQPDST